MTDFTTPHVNAGLCAKYYVKGALNPIHGDPCIQHNAVRLWVQMGLPEVAVAYMRGLAERDDTPAGPLAWHRLMGNTAVEVGVAA